MKALTIWQPWASLILIGAKPYEFRGWKVPGFMLGQRIAIHAGARPVKPGEVKDLIARLATPSLAWSTALRAEVALPLLELALRNPSSLPRSSLLCTAVLGQAVNGFSVAGEFGGVVNDSDRAEQANWAWPLSDIEPLVPPVEAKGAQGFWDWSGAC